jgi:hypothetical protein
MVRRLWFVPLLLALLSTALFAQQNVALLSPLKNAQFVYVTSFSGSQFRAGLLPSDRRAIGVVQNALQKWGHYTIVSSPRDANMIVAVSSRPSEDVLAVYDRQSWQMGTWLWRGMAKNGLSQPGMPLVHELEAALGRVTGKSVA